MLAKCVKSKKVVKTQLSLHAALTTAVRTMDATRRCALIVKVRNVTPERSTHLHQMSVSTVRMRSINVLVAFI